MANDWLDTRMGMTIQRLFDAISPPDAPRPDVVLEFSATCLEKHRRPGAILIGIPQGMQEMPPAEQPGLPARRVARDLVPRLPVKIWGRNPVEAEELLLAFIAALSTANSDDEDEDGTGYLRSEIGIESIGAWMSGTGQAGTEMPLVLSLRMPVYDDDHRRAPIDSTSLTTAVVKSDGTTES